MNNTIKTTFPGILLFEFLIYLSAFCIIIGASFFWIVQVYQPFMQKSAQMNILSSLYSAHNALIRDIYNAPSNSDEWQKIDTCEIIWHTADGDIGWSQKDNRLIRSFGIYNPRTKSWHKRKRSIAATALNTVSFLVQKEAHNVKSVQIQYIVSDGKYSIKQNVLLRNRVIS